MPSRLVERKRQYIYDVLVGTSDTFFGRIRCWLKNWYYHIDTWSEGEILDKYYELTGEK